MELRQQLDCIVHQRNVPNEKFAKRRLFVLITIAILASLAIVPYLSVESNKLYDSIDFAKLYLDPRYKEKLIDDER